MTSARAWPPSRGAPCCGNTTETHGGPPLPAGGPVPSDGAPPLSSVGQVLLLLLHRPLALLMHHRATSVTPDGSSSAPQLPLGLHSPLKTGGASGTRLYSHKDRSLLGAPRHPLVLLLTGALALSAAAVLTGTVQVPVRSSSLLPPFSVWVDAGSTGSRIHTFAVASSSSLRRHSFTLRPACDPAALQTPLTSLTAPAGPPSVAAAWTYLQPLVSHVSEACIPDGEELGRSPLHVWATAGMRLLSQHDQGEVFAALRAAVAGNTRFQLAPAAGAAPPAFATIDGESEGFFAWLAVNTLYGTDFSQILTTSDVAPALVHTVGALDLGGGSTQVVVAAPDTGGQQKRRSEVPRKALVADTDAPIAALRDVAYVRTVLGAGAVALEASVKAALLADAGKGGTEKRNNPCAFDGYDEHGSPPERVFLVGTGDLEGCMALVQSALLHLDPRPRLLPPHSTSQQFVALSLYYHVAHFLAVAAPAGNATLVAALSASSSKQKATLVALSPPPPFPFPKPTPAELSSRCTLLCALPWSVVQNHLQGVDPNTPPPRLHGRCFDCALVVTLLSSTTVGYGFPPNSRQIVFLDKVNGTAVEWTLGAAVATLHPALVAAHVAQTRANVGLGAVCALAAATLVMVTARAVPSGGGHVASEAATAAATIDVGRGQDISPSKSDD